MSHLGLFRRRFQIFPQLLYKLEIIATFEASFLVNPLYGSISIEKLYLSQLCKEKLGFLPNASPFFTIVE